MQEHFCKMPTSAATGSFAPMNCRRPQKLYVKFNLEKFRKLERRQTNGSAAELLLQDFLEIDALGPDKKPTVNPN
jgi:hypothetical protein